VTTWTQNIDLAVVDATIALQGKLPKRGEKIAFDKIVVSENLFEADNGKG